MTAAEPLGVPGLPPVRLLTAVEYAKIGETQVGLHRTHGRPHPGVAQPNPEYRGNVVSLCGTVMHMREVQKVGLRPDAVANFVAGCQLEAKSGKLGRAARNVPVGVEIARFA